MMDAIMGEIAQGELLGERDKSNACRLLTVFAGCVGIRIARKLWKNQYWVKILGSMGSSNFFLESPLT